MITGKTIALTRQTFVSKLMSLFNIRQESRGSAGDYQADEQAGVARLPWRVSGRCAGRCRAAPLASIRQMSRQVSRVSAGDYEADEQAGVSRLSWRISGR